MKRFLIKLFRLAELDQEIIKARREQREDDDKRYEKDLKRVTDKLENEKQYEIANKDAIIESRDRQIDEMLKKERDIDRKELYVKKQIKANANAAMQLYMHTQNISHYISKECAEIHRVVEDIDEHKKMIENKK